MAGDVERARAEVREEFRTWLQENWSLDLTLREWWARLADSGWAFPTWPEEWYGRGLPGNVARVVGEELSAAGALGPPAGLGQRMGGPVVIEHGDDDQRQRFVRALAAGEETWCQFFSEPGSGSDLASLQTRAERDGDEWVVNGQKVWTSGAQTADRGMLLARTDPDVPKHQGISYFVIEVDQPGIEVRPLKQMTGGASFNEVFFTDARVAHADLVGGENRGWAAAITTLAYERAGLGGGVAGGAPGRRAGQLDRKVGDIVADRRAGRGARQRMGGPALTQVAAEQGRDREPVVRQLLARQHAMAQTSTWSVQRGRASVEQGGKPGPESSVAKLARSEQTRLTRDLGPLLLGPGGMLTGEDAPYRGAIAARTLSAPSSSIAGGTDETQKNIIGERALGLPKDPQVDREIPFRELKVGTQRA